MHNSSIAEVKQAIQELGIKTWNKIFHGVFRKHKLGSSSIGKIGKIEFTTDFLTVANTL